MNDLIHQRCFNHRAREAVARCPECRRFFCRECITEHADRVLCSTCLQKVLAPRTERLRTFKFFFALIQCFIGIILAWLFFFYLGQLLLLLPDSFHNGTLWQSPWWME